MDLFGVFQSIFICLRLAQFPHHLMNIHFTCICTVSIMCPSLGHISKLSTGVLDNSLPAGISQSGGRGRPPTLKYKQNNHRFRSEPRKSNRGSLRWRNRDGNVLKARWEEKACQVGVPRSRCPDGSRRGGDFPGQLS